MHNSQLTLKENLFLSSINKELKSFLDMRLIYKSQI